MLACLNDKLVTLTDRAIECYQRYLSSLFPPCCRFEPTCSQYARDSLKKFGLFRGTVKALWRVLRCHPYSKGGHDPA